jgi:hypothetical protein
VKISTGWLQVEINPRLMSLFKTFFPYELIINFYMLGPTMVDRIRGESPGAKVVTLNYWRNGEGEMKILK